MRRFAAGIAGLDAGEMTVQQYEEVDKDGGGFSAYIKYLQRKLKHFKLMQQAMVDAVRLGIEEDKFQSLGRPEELQQYVLKSGAAELPLAQILDIAKSQIKGGQIGELQADDELLIRQQKLQEIEVEVRQRNEQKRQQIQERRRQQEQKQQGIENQLAAEELLAAENRRHHQEQRRQKAQAQLEKVSAVRTKQQEQQEKEKTRRPELEPALEEQRRENIRLRNREAQLKRQMQRADERRARAQALQQEYERQYKKNKSAMSLKAQKVLDNAQITSTSQ